MIATFLDLSEAFDTIDHRILISKVAHYGINETILKWFSYYLSNIYQFISTNGVKSDIKAVKTGVPEGEVFSPTLFNIYINDMINVSKLLHFIQIADDINVFLGDLNLPNLLSTFNNKVCKLEERLNWNKLLINISKTESIIITHNNTSINVNLKIRNQNL